MIPIRDTIQSRNYPIVNSLIIGLNVMIYILELSQGRNLNRLFLTYGLVPARYSVPEIAAFFSPGQQVFSFLSFMFLHGGFWHLLGNMWSLYIFGDNVEDRLGPVRYLLFYLFCGWTSGLFHLFVNWYSRAPTIGASGAIAGVMGAYLILYPGARILTLIPIFFFPYFVEIPAFFFLGLWFLFQFLSAAGTHGQGSGIAWWAHVGGFLCGIIMVKLLLRMPGWGITGKLRELVPRRKTRRLQVLRAEGSDEDPHLYGSVNVTPWESRTGTRKLISVPWGFKRRLLRVTIPSGVNDGTVLRLSGMGKQIDPGRKGDLYLKVLIRSR